MYTPSTGWWGDRRVTEPWTATAAARLLTPGCRLGWRYRDPASVSEPFAEAPPRLAPLSADFEKRVYKRNRIYMRLRRLLCLPSLLVALTTGLLLLAPIVDPRDAASDHLDTYVALVPIAVISAGSAVLFVLLAYKGNRHWPQWRFAKQVAADQADHQSRLAEWRQRKVAHEREQAEKKARAYRWLPVAAPGGGLRLEIVGGTADGWQALLTVYGASLLCERPVLVIDVSWGEVADGLTTLAKSAGKRIRAERLPAQLAESAVGADLAGGQLVDALVEAIHHDQTPGGRTERSEDYHVLNRLANALNDPVTVGRLVAAVQVLTNGTATDPRLSAEEIAHLRDDIFPRDNLEHARPALHRLESWLHPLQELGVRRTPPTATDLICIALSGNNRNPGNELLAELIVQDLTRRIDVLAAQRPTPAVIIAGAEEISTRHVDELAGAAQRCGVPLTLLFRHLRASSRLIGGGNVAFMRLGNHEDAGRAAEYIGQQHTFVLSSMTHTQGGDETYTTATTHGQTHTTTTSWQAGLAADPRNLTPGLDLSAGVSRSDAAERSQTQSRASGMTWSDAITHERVREYTVEPSSLQSLPDRVMLLTEPVSGAPKRITAVEVDPGIAALPQTDPSRPDPWVR